MTAGAGQHLGDPHPDGAADGSHTSTPPSGSDSGACSTVAALRTVADAVTR